MPHRCVNLAQPLYTGMPHGRKHDVPSFEQKTSTITFSRGHALVSITEIKMAAHIGTHIDAARHFFPDSHTIDQYPYGECDVNIVGTDTITPDLPVAHRSEGFDYPIHRHLLGHDVLIVENLGPGLKEVVGGD